MSRKAYTVTTPLWRAEWDDGRWVATELTTGRPLLAISRGLTAAYRPGFFQTTGYEPDAVAKAAEAMAEASGGKASIRTVERTPVPSSGDETIY